jgi:glycosyltransferase 2 family protein
VKPSTGRALRAVITLVVLGLLVLFATKVDWAATWSAARKASLPMLALAAAVNLASLVVKGIRWWVFLRPVGVRSLWLAIRATFAGAGLNNVLVANGGEAARVVFVSGATGVPAARVLATLALERLFELVGYAAMLAGSVLVLPVPASLRKTRPFAIAALLLMTAFLVYLLRRPNLAHDDDESAAAPAAPGETPTFGARLRAFWHRFVETLGGISTTPRFLAAFVLSIGVWALQVATYHLTAVAAGFPITVVGTVAALLAVNVGFAVRATPGNVGLFQFMYAATAVSLGLDKEQAIAVGFLIQAQQIIPVTLLGVLAAPEFILKRGAAASARSATESRSS